MNIIVIHPAVVWLGLAFTFRLSFKARSIYIPPPPRALHTAHVQHMYSTNIAHVWYSTGTARIQHTYSIRTAYVQHTYSIRTAHVAPLVWRVFHDQDGGITVRVRPCPLPSPTAPSVSDPPPLLPSQMKNVLVQSVGRLFFFMFFVVFLFLPQNTKYVLKKKKKRHFAVLLYLEGVGRLGV